MTFEKEHDEHQEDQSKQHPIVIPQYRGIRNISKVSCHISCAVQVLCHTIVPIQQLLLSEITNKSTNNPTTTTTTTTILQELLDFFVVVSVGGDDISPNKLIYEESWDPHRLYKHLSDKSLDYNEVGDPTISLSKLLLCLKDEFNELVTKESASTSLLFEDILKTSIWEGQTRQVLEGRKRILNDDDESNQQCSIQQRIKTSKVKPMSCPLTIKFQREETDNIMMCSVQDGLQHTLKPQLVRGSQPYPWDTLNPESYAENIIAVDQNNNNNNTFEDEESTKNEWTTTKQIEFIKIPRIWLLHLERCQSQSQIMTDMYSNIRSIHKQDQEEHQEQENGHLDCFRIDIPLVLNPSNYIADTSNIHDKDIDKQNKDGIDDSTRPSSSPSKLFLQGAILQVIEIDEEDVDDEYNDGDDFEVHTVTLLRIQQPNHRTSVELSSWVLIDDEVCEVMEEDQAIKLMKGTVITTDRNDMTTYKYFGASLLVYSIAHDEAMTAWKDLVRKISLELKNKSKSFEAVTTESTTADTTDPSKLIGRRLTVKWAKGKFYPGIISNYDPVTRKHRVKYDDGDIKEYILCKKTIEWIDD
jgi:hypothetical protein